ncbi:MAG: ubiquitin family protein [Thermoplasmatota archaeon]
MRVVAHLHGFPPPKERALDLEPGADADALLTALQVRQGIALVFRGDAPIPGDAKLGEGDVVRVLRVVSGG